jgi:AraC-like DNA-binding protein
MAQGHEWELVRRLPHPALQGAVVDYQGFRERVIGTLRRREIPAVGITVIINLGPPLWLGGPDSAGLMSPQADSFVAGLSTTYTLVETVGEMEGIEVTLTPTGARRLFGVPMAELTDQVVGLDDVFGRMGRAAVARIRAEPTWPDRFAMLDRELSLRLNGAPMTPAAVQHAWQRMAAADGRLSVGALASELAWSPKRLVTTFRDQIGLGPKQLARLFRFQQAVKAMSRPGARLTSVAYAAGYYDQAHLIRDVREFSGVSPTELLRQAHPESLGFIDG